MNSTNKNHILFPCLIGWHLYTVDRNDGGGERERAGRKDVDKYVILFKAFQCLGKGNLCIDKSILDTKNV